MVGNVNWCCKALILAAAWMLAYQANAQDLFWQGSAAKSPLAAKVVALQAPAEKRGAAAKLDHLRCAQQSGPGAAAELTALELSMGQLPLPLQPEFVPCHTDYRAYTSNEVTVITAAWAAMKPGTTVKLKVNGIWMEDPDAEIQLPVGATNIELEVAAQDGAVQRSYTVEVIRAPSSHAWLDGLEVQADGAVVQLSPEYAPALTQYELVVPDHLNAVTINWRGLREGAVVQVMADGILQAGNTPIRLATVQQTIDIVVTAEDGRSTNVYTIRLLRSPG